MSDIRSRNDCSADSGVSSTNGASDTAVTYRGIVTEKDLAATQTSNNSTHLSTSTNYSNTDLPSTAEPFDPQTFRVTSVNELSDMTGSNMSLPSTAQEFDPETHITKPITASEFSHTMPSASSGLCPTSYTETEARINHSEITQSENSLSNALTSKLSSSVSNDSGIDTTSTSNISHTNPSSLSQTSMIDCMKSNGSGSTLSSINTRPQTSTKDLSTTNTSLLDTAKNQCAVSNQRHLNNFDNNQNLVVDNRTIEQIRREIQVC